jgi:type IV secretory pathway VirB10-like protein
MTPSVNQNTVPPPGNLPRNRQTYILLGVALLIVAAVAFSTPGGSPSGTAAPKPAPVTSPTKSEIEQYGKQLQAEEARLRRAQAEADRARNAFEQQVGPAPLAAGMAANDTRPVSQPGEPPKSTFEQEKERREYTSLFASNVALSLPAPPNPLAPGAQETPSSTSATTAKPPGKAQRYVLFEGSIIETALTNRLNGSFTGPVNCQVTTDVWSRDHQHLLIPQGTRVLGEAQRVTGQDQERLAIAFHRLIMPDGYAVDLNRLPGLDQLGAAAVADQVNHHYLSTFGTSVLLGVISGFAISGTSAGYSASGVDAYRQGVASQMSQSSARILDRGLSRLPTITIREGQRIKVYVSRDLELPDVKDHGREVL